jgi:acyl-CoA synthetase (AMP-forming)/AMP-acid ligase II
LKKSSMEHEARTVLEAMSAVAQVDDRGFRFADTKEELFVSFRTLTAEVRRVAASFQVLKLSYGDRLAIIMPDHQPFIIAFLAALSAGLIPVLMYPPLSLTRYENWNETAKGILGVAGASAIVTVAELRPLLWSIAAQFNVQLVTLEELANENRVLDPIVVDPDELAFLQFTSGSTGTPRGVMVSHRNIVANCHAIAANYHAVVGPYTSAADGCCVSWLPLYHDMGLIGAVLAPLFAGQSTIFLATLAFLKRPTLWFELIHRHRGTVTFAPNFAYALCARRVAAQDIARWDLSCLQIVFCGGEPIAAETLRTFARRFAPAGFRTEMFLPTYGLAEATLAVSMGRRGESWRSDIVDAGRLRSTEVAITAAANVERMEVVGCGIPLPGHTVNILDKEGRPLPERAIGEVEFRGPSVTLGYFEDQQATAEVYRNNGLRTGDLGYIADGELFITGRKKDLIIVHGRNYAPQEIEWSVERLREVRKGSVVAFAGKQEEMGDNIVIVCEATTKAFPELERAIRRRVSDELALAIRDVIIVRPGVLPKTSSGKIKRAPTRQLYLDGALIPLAAAKHPVGMTRRLLEARLYFLLVLGRFRYIYRRTLRLLR